MRPRDLASHSSRDSDIHCLIRHLREICNGIASVMRYPVRSMHVVGECRCRVRSAKVGGNNDDLGSVCQLLFHVGKVDGWATNGLG